MIASAALRNRGPRTWAVPRWLATVLLVTRVGHGLRGAAGGVGDRQVLDTDNWTSAGSRLLENPAIRAQTPEFLADRAFEDADLQEQIRAVLPPRAQPLAAPAAGFVRDRLERRANEALARPDVQRLWEDANRDAHARLLEVLDDDGPLVLDLDAMPVILVVLSLALAAAALAGSHGRHTARSHPRGGRGGAAPPGGP